MASTEEKEEWLERIRDIFDNKIPFNKVLGLQGHSLAMERPKIRFAMHDALVGHYIRSWYRCLCHCLTCRQAGNPPISSFPKKDPCTNNGQIVTMPVYLIDVCPP